MLRLENITLGFRKGNLDVTCAKKKKMLCYALYKAYTWHIVYGK